MRENWISYAFAGDTTADTIIGLLLLLLAGVGLGLFFYGLDLMGSPRVSDLGIGAVNVFAGASLVKIGLTTGY